MEASSPSSPGVAPVSLQLCIEEILQFLFSCEETLDFDLGLSKDYCSHLLRPDPDDDHHHSSHDVEHSEGVPFYPLYKHLASMLHCSITTGAFCRISKKMPLIEENGSGNQREIGWSKLIIDKGFELMDMLKLVKFELHVQEPFFSLLRAGQKTIEGRCAVGDYNQIVPGNLLLINKCLLLEVLHVRRYPSFLEMIEAESLTKVLPGVRTVEEGIQVYRRFYSDAKEKANGVLAIDVLRHNSQPYRSIACIIEGLSYEGIGSLLGLAHTPGTVPDALPPPRSALLSSFATPYKPNVAS